MHYTLVAQPGRYPIRRQHSTPALVYRTRQQRLTLAFVCTLLLHRVQLILLSHIFRRGSRASRKPSPNRLNASTVRKIAIPGKRHSQGLISKIIRPAFRSQPQLGVGGCVPSPRKLSEASAMIDVPTLSVEVTMRGAMQLGRMCRHSRRGSRTARALAASTYVRVLTDSTLPRTMRA